MTRRTTLAGGEPAAAAVYVRLSRDRVGAGLAIDRQEADCRELAERQSLQVGSVYRDNDLSAYSGKPRPGYLAMLDDIRAGKVGVVLAWHTDRLHRSPVELETYIDACDAAGVATYTVKAGHIDLATPSGRMIARMLGASARYEVEHMIERQKRAKLQAATDGKWRGGRRPYGYADDGVTVLPDEAAVVLDASRAVLTGVSLRRVARDLNERQTITSTGRPWTPDAVRKVLLRPRNAGLVEHDGEIVGRAKWPEIVPETVWRGVVAALTDPIRRTQFSSVLRWMGSGLYQCHCGATVRAMANAANRNGTKSAYTCTTTKHLTRVAAEVDDLVSDVVIERLTRPDAETLLVVDGPDDASVLDLQARALRARLDELAALYATDGLTASQLTTGSSLLRQQLAAIEGQIADLNRTSVLAGLVGQVDTRAVWFGLDLDRRRAVISRLMTVVLLPSTKGRRKGWRPGESYFDPASVRIDWKV